MFLVLEDQNTKSLKRKVFPEVCMPHRILFIFINNFLSVVCLITRSRSYNKLYLILHFDKQIISVGLSCPSCFQTKSCRFMKSS